MAGLLEPAAGQIILRQEIRLQYKFGIVCQEPNLLEWRTVRENIELPLVMLDRRVDEHAGRTERLLELMGLAAFRDLFPWQLSGGMQQRVAIARTLLLDPPILFMDDPFSGLDTYTKEALQLELLGLKCSAGKTIVIVTPSISDAVFLSDRMIVLSGSPGQVHSVLHTARGEASHAEFRMGCPFHELTAAVRRYLEPEGGVSSESSMG